MALFDTQSIESEDGIKKTIEESSMGIALDILQRGIYSFPIKSTIRELTSNSYDAIKERDVAKNIISGESKVEDFFDVSKDLKGVHANSGWDRDYFDTQWLSDDPYSYIYYEEGNLRDKLRFVDHGVGLGRERLRGYFNLNFSSKRANKTALGKWGLGSKVAFSLGVESFRVISKYNGMKFVFDVYLDKVDSIIPRFGKNGPNQSHEIVAPLYSDEDKDGNRELLKPGYNAYWEPTTDLNGLELQIEVKKHNKDAFFQAMESQLMYLANVKILYKEEGNITYEDKSISNNILYKDNDIIVSDSNVFRMPHILLGTGDALINYGFVEFSELELENKTGPVGLIMDINDIDITPSREAPVWSAKTRKAVLEKYESVVATVTNKVAKSMSSESDYLSWLIKCTNIKQDINNMSASSIVDKESENYLISVFSRIVDLSKLDFSFPPNPKEKYSETIKTVIPKQFSIRRISFDSSRGLVKREALKVFDVASTDKVYITDKSANMYRDRYLNDSNGTFVLISYDPLETANKTNWKIDALINSTIAKDYNSITVPDDILDTYKKSNITDEEDVADGREYTDWRAQRIENKQIIVHRYGYGTFSAVTTNISDLSSLYDGHILVYGTSADREMLKLGNEIVENKFIKHNFKEIQDNSYQFLLIAQENIKHIKSFQRYVHINKFLTVNSDKKSLIFRKYVKALFMLIALTKDSRIERSLRFFSKNHSFANNTKAWFTTNFPTKYLQMVQHYSDVNPAIAYEGFTKHLLAIYQANIVQEEPDSIHLTSINNELPNCFSDKMTIKTINIMDRPLLEYIMYHIQRALPITSDLFEVIDHYSYVNDIKKLFPIFDLTLKDAEEHLTPPTE